MNELGLFEKKNQVVVSSRDVARVFEKRHDNVLKDIRELKISSEFRLLNFEESNYLNEQSKQQPQYILTRDGFAIIAMGYTGKKAMQFKEAYINTFNRMESLLRERQTTDWLETRKKGKIIRRMETDVIQQLIPYAIEQGSKNAKMFYANYSALVNKTVGIENGTRGEATHKQLMLVALIEDMISNTILEEMANGVYYKEIYKICKAKVLQFATLAYIGESKGRVAQGGPFVPLLTSY